MKYVVIFLRVSTALFLLALAAAYAYCAPINHQDLVDKALYHPLTKLDEPSYQVTEAGKKEDLYFTCRDGNKLNGWFFERPGSRQVVLFSHGNAGNMSHRTHKIKQILDLGASVLAYDYQGYGKSEGKPSLQGLIDSGCAAYDVLTREKHYKPEQIILYGESLGTGVTTQIARRRPCAAVVLESAFLSPIALARGCVPLLCIYPSILWPGPNLDNLAYVKENHPQLLIIHGVQDKLIDVSNGKQLFAQAREPKALALLPDCGHNNIGFEHDKNLYSSALRELLLKADQNAPLTSNALRISPASF